MFWIQKNDLKSLGQHFCVAFENLIHDPSCYRAASDTLKSSFESQNCLSA